jgi:hypothetical protein
MRFSNIHTFTTCFDNSINDNGVMPLRIFAAGCFLFTQELTMLKILFRTFIVFSLALPLGAQAISDAELQQAADAVNQRTPLMVDKDTRLDNATSGKQRLIYNYTLINYKSGDLDREKFESALRPGLLKAGCQTLKPLLSEGVSVHYVYKGKDAGTVGSVILSPGDCGF